ncbi:urea carboxylase-associated family protein [Qaidamihabitans albus]|uniref:urea carboxylase-associated family protein n=1 Tax=Qaidamihabitans albus TaxID=2795733 RepID=UPI0018F24C60|nr:urea carboxylase-associated family protein [Qaidamihabitans albus]
MTTTSSVSATLTAGAYQTVSLGYGETLRITDVGGGQCCQVIPVNHGDRRERFSAPNTMLLNKQVYFTTGSTLYSYFCNPMLTIIGTTCTHDALPGRLPAGDDVLARKLLTSAFASLGLARHQIPYPFLAFVRHTIAEDGSIDVACSESAAGDTVHLRADLDVDVVVASTPELLGDSGATGVVALDVLPSEEGTG